jgi:serine/threonine-protein kinase haspin
LAPVAAAAAAAALAALGARSAVASLGAALGATSLQDTAAADTHASEFVSNYAAENLSFAKFLGECGQTATEVLCMSDALASYAGAWKIGEGTYGEAFKFGNTVLKIVPIAGDALVNGEPQMGCAQIAGEAAVARRLTSLRPTHSASHSSRKNVTSGFIDTKNVFVCVGPYARDLLDEWVAYDETKTSENENPGKFPRDQLYAVFASSDGGVDLERATIQNHAEATSILLQVTIALAVAEEACRFEHRDLHWGNVLLKPCGVDETKHATLNGVQLVYPTRGVDVNVIDFTLSRLDLGGGGDGVVGKGDDDVDTSKSSQTSQNLAYCDLGADPELFNGPEGHCQSETYRLMANAVAGDWSAHVPKTNALWLRYLADCLSSDKKYPCTHVELAELKAFKKRAAGYASAQEALWDGLFVGVFKTNYGG